MSIKIYNGYQLNPFVNFTDFQNKVRENLRNYVVEHASQEYNETLLYQLDRYSFGNDIQEISKFVRSDQFVKIIEELYNGNLVFYFHESGIYFSDFLGSLTSKHLAKTFSNDINDFSYWDNCDRPDTISDDEWKYRKNIWSEIMSDFRKTPEESGLTMQLFTTTFFSIHACGLGLNHSDATKIQKALKTRSYQDRIQNFVLSTMYKSFGYIDPEKVGWKEFLIIKEKCNPKSKNFDEPLYQKSLEIVKQKIPETYTEDQINDFAKKLYA